MKPFNKTSFAKLEKSTIKAGQTVADNLQSLIEMGLSHFSACGDTEFLTRCVQTAIKARSVKADSVKLYIRDHANVKWVEVEGKEPCFKKAGKGAVEVTEPSQTWYEYTGQDKVTPDWDLEKRIEALIKQAQKKVEEDAVADEKVARTLELTTKLQSLIKADIDTLV